MEGITDAPMRALQGATGGFTYAVSEFMRVSDVPIPKRVFRRSVPELTTDGKTPTGLPVQVQILGGDPELMALSALQAVAAGAFAIDINFGCPAKTVNRHDGGASLLQHPKRIRTIVSAVRNAVPAEIPVSAKLRLGWESIDPIQENAEMAAQGGANWITIHARTRMQGYLPPVYWGRIGDVRSRFPIPIIANGDIWTKEDFLRCQDETGCCHFMLGRGALANPTLSRTVASELGLRNQEDDGVDWDQDQWLDLLVALEEWTGFYNEAASIKTLLRFKQWMKIASVFGGFKAFDAVKQARDLDEFYGLLERSLENSKSRVIA